MAFSIGAILTDILASAPVKEAIGSAIKSLVGLNGSGKRLLAIELLQSYNGAINRIALEVVKKMEAEGSDSVPVTTLFAIMTAINIEASAITVKAADKDGSANLRRLAESSVSSPEATAAFREASRQKIRTHPGNLRSFLFSIHHDPTVSESYQRKAKLFLDELDADPDSDADSAGDVGRGDRPATLT